MRRGRVLLVLAAVAAGSCQMAVEQWRFSPETGDRMIGMCLREYVGAKGLALSDEADRVYVYSRWDVSWLNFATGDEGSFGEFSPDFQHFLGCNVATQPRLQVQRLWIGMFDIIVDVKPKTFEPFHHPTDEFVVSLYVRDGDGFSHVETRPYLPDEVLEKLDRMHERLRESSDLPRVLTIQ